MRRSRLEIATLGLLAALLVGGAACLLGMPRGEVLIARYATSLKGRTTSQIHNARLAAEAIDGTIVQPGKGFSFNRTVGPWQADTGYKRAPVSYDGELVLAWGGGVCQTSTALYNAALLAGVDIVERHRHAWAPTYVTPGRDAAVASGGIDLRFHNTLASPVRIRGRTVGDNLIFEVLSTEPGPWRVEVAAEVHADAEPSQITEIDPGLAPGHRRVVTTARAGFRANVYRTFSQDDETRRELVSADAYPPLNGLVRVGPEQGE
jgi:vancomycin resistance protein VanW